MSVIFTGEQVLSVVQENIDPGAVIAGGWVRDQVFNKEPKDIDIWITKSFNYTVLLELLPGCSKIQRFYARNLTDKRLINVTKVKYQEADIDIICFDPAALGEHAVSFNPIESFDFGICQCWFDGHNNKGYQYTDTFLNDVRNETLTYLSNAINDNRIEQIITKRIPRLKEKFPDFDVVGLERDGDSYRLIGDPKPRIPAVKPEGLDKNHPSMVADVEVAAIPPVPAPNLGIGPFAHLMRAPPRRREAPEQANALANVEGEGNIRGARAELMILDDRAARAPR